MIYNCVSCKLIHRGNKRLKCVNAMVESDQSLQTPGMSSAPSMYLTPFLCLNRTALLSFIIESARPNPLPIVKPIDSKPADDSLTVS